jgi:DNA (cytosine-5)-methyltransferase 1
MAPPIITALSLFSGVAGLDLGVAEALGGRVRVLGYCEREAYAAAVLLARMEDSSLEPAPVWCGDIADMDLAPFVGVDLITAGAPCQPYSVAGKRQGEADERYLWPTIFRVIETCRPALVFLENVPGIITWFRPIGEELCRMGYELEAGLFSAAEVGAPHRRERLFVLVHEHGRGLAVLPREAQRNDAHGCDSEVADPDAALRDEPGRRNGACWSSASEPGYAGEGMAHTASLRCSRDTTYTGSSREGEGGWRLREPPRSGDAMGNASNGGRLVFPPGPGDAESWQRWLAAGGPVPAERGVCRGTHGLRARVDRLHALGNAVVPSQAAKAFRCLVGGGSL